MTSPLLANLFYVATLTLFILLGDLLDIDSTVNQNIASTVYCQNEAQIHRHTHKNWSEVTHDTQSAQIL